MSIIVLFKSTIVRNKKVLSGRLWRKLCGSKITIARANHAARARIYLFSSCFQVTSLGSKGNLYLQLRHLCRQRVDEIAAASDILRRYVGMDGGALIGGFQEALPWG